MALPLYPLSTVIDPGVQAAIILEIGDPEGTLPAVVAEAWTAYAAKGVLVPELQRLYAKRAGINAKLAERREDVDFSQAGDLMSKDSQRWVQLEGMRLATQAELERVERITLASRAPVAVQIAPVPLSPDGYRPETTDPRLVGSPFYPTRRRWP